MQHKQLAAGQWSQLDFATQMGNIGSEVERCIKWREKGQTKIAQEAFLRSIELLALSIDAAKNNPSRLHELTRTRECWFDFFAFENEYGSTSLSWRQYFGRFALLAQRSRG